MDTPLGNGLIEGTIEIIFRGAFKSKFNDEKRIYQLTLREKVVLSRTVIRLFISAIYIAAVGLTTFFEIFLIEESFGCDPGLDCFYTDTTDPIENCEDLDGNRTIICYNFGLNLASAAGAAGGFLAVASMIINVAVLVVFWVAEKIVQSGNYKNKKFCFFSVYISVVIVLVILFIVYFVIAILQSTPSRILNAKWSKQKAFNVILLSLASIVTLVIVGTVVPSVAFKDTETASENHTTGTMRWDIKRQARNGRYGLPSEGT